MWIYYYASFGPGHQSNDYGFESFNDTYSMDGIQEYLFNHIDSCGYSISLEFWKVERPPADYVNDKIKDMKDEIRNLQTYLNKLKFQDSFDPEEKEGEDVVIQRNLRRCIDSYLLRRLHKAGLMYSASDLSNWRYGKKCPIEPHRSKILRIMRGTKKCESGIEQLKKLRNKRNKNEIQ